jgi:uncharacterized protein YgiM (DUF1202 family)
MFRYLLLLGGALFLALTIVGHDRGQLRAGLTGAYAPPPPVPLVPAAAARAEESPVVLATYAPEEPAAEPVSETAPAPVAASPVGAEVPAALPVMWVDASSVNLREAPSTESAVLGKLRRAEAVTVVAEAPDGWLKVRLEGDGGEGFVAARYLTAQDPATN